MPLPTYDPPPDRRAALAAGLAPLLVLLAFTLIVVRVVEPDTGLAVVLAASAWLVWEMHEHQRRIDAYNADYVAAHLQWRSPATLTALTQAEPVHLPTRDFVRRFEANGREWLPDGQLR